MSLLKASKMELMEKVPIKIDKNLVPMALPEELILYTIDSSHLLLAIKPLRDFETKALSKNNVKVKLEGNEYLVELPKKIYNFYHMDEADYTVMVSEISPRTIEILL